MYTVKQLSTLAQVSVRTLHHYDEIGLLEPTTVAANGYRYYDDDALLRLQQILFYREVGLPLVEIKTILDSPDFDLIRALRAHRETLKDKVGRLEKLVETIDSTIRHLTGEIDMPKKRLFEAFSDEQQKEYERSARLQYGPENVNESARRWNSYGPQKRQAILDEGNVIYTDMVNAILAGQSPTSPEVQMILVRWHEHIRYFYEPTLEILRGMGELYTTDPDFRANFDQMHANLAEYMREGITQYVDDLEDAEIRKMLAEDEARTQRLSE